MTSLRPLFGATLVAMTLAATTSYGAVLLSWNTTNNVGTETTEPSVSNLPGVLAASLTLGSGVTPAANGNRFGGSNWFDTGDTNPTTLSESIAGNDYLEFILTPDTGYEVTPTNFSFIWGRSGTGPNNLALRSSVDGFAANLGVATGVADSTSVFTNIPISGLVDLTTPVTFRLYGYGATGTGGTGGFDTVASAQTPNVILEGAVPEPTTLASTLGLLALAVRRRK